MSDPSPLPARVAAALAAVRRRRRALALAQAMAWTTLGVAAVVVSAGTLIGPEPISDGVRLAARFWLVASVLVPFLLFVVPPWRRTASDLDLARAIDDRAPTKDSLWTAVDLAGSLETLVDPETRRLAHRQLDEAGARAATVDAKALVPWSALATGRQAGPVGLVLLVAVFVGLPEDARNGLERLLGPPPEVVEEAAVEEDEPVTLVLRNVRLRLTPPAYSKRQPLDLPGTTGDFQALPGTDVVLEADLPVSGRSGRITWAKNVLSTADVKGKHLEFHFKSPTEGSGTYRVRLARGIGPELVTRAFRIDALRDKSPELEVLGPTTAIELRPGQTVPLEVRTSDDFGLTRLERVVERNGREIARFPIAVVTGQAEAVERLRWDPLADLPKAGGELALIIESYDNDDVNGPKVTRSRPVEVYIPTARDQHLKVLALQEQLLNAALDLLAEVLVNTEMLRGAVRGGLLRTELLTEHEVQAQAAAQMFDIAGRLADAMRRDSLARPGSFIGTGRVMENLARRWSGIDEYVEREVQNDPGVMVNLGIAAGLVKLRDAASVELEQAVLDLADFVDLDRASAALAEVANVDAGLSDLADLVREGLDGGLVDEARIQEALAALQQAMAEAAKKLSERRGGPDDGFQNQLPQAADQSTVDSIEKALQEGRFDDALAMIQKAQDALAQQSEALQEEMKTRAGSQDADELAKALSEAIEEAKQLESRQESLLAESEDLIQKFGSGDGMAPTVQEQILKEMDELLSEIGNIPEGIEDQLLKFSAGRWASRSGRAAEAMRSAFAEGGIEEAIALGLQTQRELQNARQGLEIRASGESAVGGAKRAEGRARAASRTAQGLIERLESAEMSANTQRRAAGSAGEGTQRGQNRLALDTAGLRGRVEQMGGSAFNPVAGRDSLQAAEDLMLRAGGRLGQGRPGTASGAQDGALQQLRRFRQSLEQAQGAMAQGSMPGGGPPMPGGRQPGESGQQSDPWSNMNAFNGDEGGEVVMPEPEDFLGPDAFRDLVLEGAQDDAPERYRPLNGSYYEELVR